MVLVRGLYISVQQVVDILPRHLAGRNSRQILHDYTMCGPFLPIGDVLQ